MIRMRNFSNRPRDHHAPAFSAARRARRVATALAGFVAIVLAIAWVPTTDAAPKERAVIAELSWDGALAIAHVLKAIIETRLGGKADLLLADQAIVFAAMDKGDGGIDVHPDLWMPNQAGFWNRYIAEGSRESIVVNKPYHAKQGLFVPRYVQTRFGIKSVHDLSRPEVARLFDSDGDGKGEFWSGAPGWAATNIEKVKAKSYGYAKYFAPLEVPVATFQDKLKADYRRKRPVLFYYWTPEWLHAVYDLVMLEEPPFDGYAMEGKRSDPHYNPRGCWKMYQPKEKADWYEASRITCAWPEAQVYIAYSTSLTRRAPRIARFLSQATLTADQVGHWITAMTVEDQEPAEMARAWIAAHADTVNGWLQGIAGPP